MNGPEIYILGGAAIGGIAGHALGHTPDKQLRWTVVGAVIGALSGYALYVHVKQYGAVSTACGLPSLPKCPDVRCPDLSCPEPQGEELEILVQS